MVVTTEDTQGTSKRADAAAAVQDPLVADPTHPELPPALVKKGGKGSLQVVWVNPGKPIDEADEDVSEVVAQSGGYYLTGSGFEAPCEVVLSFDSLERPEYNTRFSAWTDDGNVRMQLQPYDFPGTYRVTAYVPEEEVGKGREDHRRVLKQVTQTTITVRR